MSSHSKSVVAHQLVESFYEIEYAPTRLAHQKFLNTQDFQNTLLKCILR